jgi:hypothetical protein
MSQTSSDVELCVEALTLHPRGLLLLLRNFRSLKYLTTAQDKRNSGISNARIECKSDSCPRTIAAGIVDTCSRNGGFTFCDELRSCLQVLSRY